MPTQKFSQDKLKEARDYAISEPSFTAAFMAWEKGWSPSLANMLTNELFRLGIIVQIEARSGPYAAVYVYNQAERAELPVRPWPLEPEPGATEAPRRGVQVPHVSPQGPSGRPGRDRRRQQAGVHVKRKKTDT